MLGKIGPIVSAGINMKFMRNVARRQGVIQRLSAGVKSEVILRAAIEINLQPKEFRRPRDFQRIVPIPVSAIEWRSESTGEKPHARTLRTFGHTDFWEILNKRSAVRAHGTEKFRMKERQTQRSVPAHRKPCD